MLTDIECRSALANLYFIALLNCQNEKLKVELRKEFDVLVDLINEHFDNPPLKFEEIDDGIIVWDSLSKEYIEICDSFNEQKIFYKFGINIPYIFMFQENRFYRKQVE